MRIGIDISQVVYEGTGVGRYVGKLVEALVSADIKNEYVLFGSSLRQRKKIRDYFDLFRNHHNVKLVLLPFPPTLFDIIWNRMHVVPVEWFTGSLDVFWSSDWTQPPLTHAAGITTIHDVSFLKYPESFNETILNVQTRRLKLAAKECKLFLCDSEATLRDVNKLLNIDKSKLKVVYPGFN
jgi:glycosyltransferase involved in cell wall biosynthesis